MVPFAIFTEMAMKSNSLRYAILLHLHTIPLTWAIVCHMYVCGTQHIGYVVYVCKFGFTNKCMLTLYSVCMIFAHTYTVFYERQW